MVQNRQTRIVKDPMERKREILDGAMELFAYNGYEQTSMRDIARHLNISLGLCYRYFDSKQKLFQEAMQQYVEDLCASYLVTLHDEALHFHEKLDALFLKMCIRDSDQGVDTIFGYPGGSVLNIYDALYERSEDIRHIITSHEQGASHAADGYARSTGRTGVCLATSGPGATNLVTGIATAYMDSIPMVAITGNV